MVDSKLPDRSLTRVFVLDDHAMLREALADLIGLTDDLVVVGSAGSADEAVDGLLATRPDVALLDARLATGSGMDVCRYLHVHQPQVRCVILTSHSNEDAWLSYLLSGADGFLLKQFRGTDLLDGIRAVAAGHRLPNLADRDGLSERLSRARIRRGSTLTPTEQSILDDVINDEDNQRIAEHLQLSEGGLRTHLDAVFFKLGLGGPVRELQPTY